MRTEYTRKFSFLVVAVKCKITKGKEQLCAVMITPIELPINNEARNEAHIANTGVRLYLW